MLEALSRSNMDDRLTIDTRTLEYCKTKSVDFGGFGMARMFTGFGFNGLGFFLLFLPWNYPGYKFLFGKTLHEEFLNYEYL